MSVYSGTSSYCYFSDTGRPIPCDGRITLSAWINWTAWGSGSNWSNPLWLTRSDDANGRGILIELEHYDSNRLYTYVYDGGWDVVATSSLIPTLDKWHHVCVSLDVAAGVRISVMDARFDLQGGDSGGYILADYFDQLWVNSMIGTNRFDGAISDIAIWGAALTKTEIRELYNRRNPRSIRRGALRGYWPMRHPGDDRDLIGGRRLSQRTGTFVRGASDPGVAALWGDPLDGLPGRTLFFAAVDETVASDADYIYTLTPNAVVEFALSSVTDPSASTGHIVRVRARSQYGQRAKFSLYQGGTLIAEWTDTLTASFATYEHTLAGAEADAITDYAALRIRITALPGA